MAEEEKSFNERHSDSAFLYFLFTFQCIVCLFGIYMWFKKFFGSPAYRREKKVTPFKLTLQLIMIVLNIFWMANTYRLIQVDIALQGVMWEPWTPLGLTPPANYFEGFNPPEVKKAYRALAKVHHPDKATDDSEEAKARWLDIQKAYDCLTTREKFDNWIEYGNPDGSSLRRSIDIALPSWLTDENNHVMVLTLFFMTFIMIPVIIIAKLKDSNDPKDIYFENGVVRDSAKFMLATLKDILERNMRRKQKTISEDQWIEVIESSEEMQTINYDLAKKNTVRDIVRNMTRNLAVTNKFEDAQKQIN